MISGFWDKEGRSLPESFSLSRSLRFQSASFSCAKYTSKTGIHRAVSFDPLHVLSSKSETLISLHKLLKWES